MAGLTPHFNHNVSDSLTAAPSWPGWLRRLAASSPMLLFLLISGFVTFNAMVHPPQIGYDAGSHLGYIVVLAEGKLPTSYDTSEFFSPPLPYAIPALAYAAGLSWPMTEKLAQALNILVSAGTILGLIRLSQLIHPRLRRYTIASLCLLALMPVYYKSFAFVRGEPWLALFTVLVTYEATALALQSASDRQLKGRFMRLGVWLGLAVLARQWGFILWMAVALFLPVLWWRRRRAGKGRWRDRGLLAAGGGAVLIALLLGGWFYLHLQLEYGSAAAFNRPLRTRLSLNDISGSFLTGLGDGLLFSDPVRPSFANQLWPQFYADFWGDHQAYFLVYGRDLRTNKFLSGQFLEDAWLEDGSWLQSNRQEMAVVLGRVNRVALGITALLLGGLVCGAVYFWRWLKNKSADHITIALSFVWLLTALSIAGYFAFLVLVPNAGNGDTVKATYLLHIYPLLALLSGELMELVRRRTRLGYGLIWAVILITAVFMLPLFRTHYVL